MRPKMRPPGLSCLMGTWLTVMDARRRFLACGCQAEVCVTIRVAYTPLPETAPSPFRTGLVALLLLTLVGVKPQAIADDYERSEAELPPLFEALDRQDDSPLIRRILNDKGTIARNALLTVLDGLDARDYLRSAGVAEDDLAAIRCRMLN